MRSLPGEEIFDFAREIRVVFAIDKLDAMLIEGLRSGDSIPVDAKFWNELKQEAMTKLAARRKRARK